MASQGNNYTSGDLFSLQHGIEKKMQRQIRQ